MKRMLDFTSDELMDLSSEECVQLVDLECAHGGIRLLTAHPGERPESVKAEPDVKCFEVCGLLFDNEEIARCVADFINSKRRMDTFYHRNEYRYGSPEGVRMTDRVELVTTKKFWSAVHYEENRVQMELARVETDKFDELEREYDAISKEREDISSKLTSLIGDASNERNRIERIVKGFEKYVVIANGDRHVALNFFLNSNQFEEDLIRKVLDFPLEIEEKEIG